ncbi:hypothetical protein BS78_04G213800 [Paspalum vaginatum]|nr:hypothetical protein BS78_04G213800 [Paspalum vaginatum]
METAPVRGALPAPEIEKCIADADCGVGARSGGGGGGGLAGGGARAAVAEAGDAARPDGDAADWVRLHEYTVIVLKLRSPRVSSPRSTSPPRCSPSSRSAAGRARWAASTSAPAASHHARRTPSSRHAPSRATPWPSAVVWIVAAGSGQEDIRAGWGEHTGQRAGELQGARHRVDDRIPPCD